MNKKLLCVQIKTEEDNGAFTPVELYGSEESREKAKQTINDLFDYLKMFKGAVECECYVYELYW